MTLPSKGRGNARVPNPKDVPSSAASAAATPTRRAEKAKALSPVIMANVERLSASRGLTFADLVRLCGMPSTNLLYNYRSGLSSSLSARSLRQVSDALGVSVDELLRAPAGSGQPAPRAEAAPRVGQAGPGDTPALQEFAKALEKVAASQAALRVGLEVASQASQEALAMAMTLLRSS